MINPANSQHVRADPGKVRATGLTVAHNMMWPLTIYSAAMTLVTFRFPYRAATGLYAIFMNGRPFRNMLKLPLMSLM